MGVKPDSWIRERALVPKTYPQGPRRWVGLEG